MAFKEQSTDYLAVFYLSSMNFEVNFVSLDNLFLKVKVLIGGMQNNMTSNP